MMSEHEETIRDDGHRECPYCGAKIYVESDEYSERQREEECPDCGKNFHASDSFSVTHYAKPDCELNGAEHRFEGRSIGDGQTHPFCAVCDKIGQRRETR